MRNVPVLKVALVRDGPARSRSLVDRPEAAYRVVKDLGQEDREHFVAVRHEAIKVSGQQ